MEQSKERAPGREAAPDLRSADAFTAWLEPHWPAMAALAARSSNDPDDILQEALAAAWRKRAQFDPARGTARTWLLAITADQRWKAGRSAARLFAHRTTAPPQWAAAPMAALDGVHLDVERAVRQLPTRQRLAVDLYYFLGLTVAEAAGVMRCAEGTVKSTLSDARRRLRDLLGEDYL
ncbi:MAG: RNA polymerase sigma factor [Arachnia sp.]